MLEPVTEALAVMRRRRGPAGTAGLADDLVVSDPDGWIPASGFRSGDRLDELVAAAQEFWRAEPHVAAALAWRMYTYWLVMPPVLGYVTAGRVPLVHPDDVLVRINEQAPFVTVGLRRLQVAVREDDPLAGADGAVAVADERHLRRVLRDTLRTDHADSVLARVQERVRLGTRTLLGSLASAAAYAVVRGLDAPSDRVRDATRDVLSILEVDDLVSLEPGEDGHVTVWRHTCCLAFSIPEPKICSGCPLRRPSALSPSAV